MANGNDGNEGTGAAELPEGTGSQAGVFEIPPTPEERESLNTRGATTGQSLTSAIVEGATERVSLYKIAFKEGLEAAPDLARAEFENALSKIGLEAEAFLSAPLELMTRFKDETGAGALAVRDMVQRATALNMSAIKSGIYGINTQGEMLAEATSKAVREMSMRKIRLSDGIEIDAIKTIGSVQNFLDYYSRTILDNQRLFRAGVEAQSEDLMLKVGMAQRNMGLSAATVTEIFEREFSETGKITGEALKNYQANIIATARETDIPIESIRKSFETMTSDFTRFGMIADDQMGNVVAKLDKLGLTINDVSNIASKFSTFEGAVSAMSNLAASTGVAIDALEMFELANTDMAGFIDRFKESLDMQGLEFEDLNFIQQKQIASSFGIDPIILKRILSDNFESAEDITAELAKEREKLKTGEELTGVIAQMTDFIDAAPKEYAMMRAQFAATTTELAKDFEVAAKAMALISQDTGEQYLDRFVAATETRRRAIAGFGQAVIDAKKAQDALLKEPKENPTPQTQTGPEVPVPPGGTGGTPAPTGAVTAAPEVPTPGSAPVATPQPPVAGPLPQQQVPDNATTTTTGATNTSSSNSASSPVATSGPPEVVVRFVVDAANDPLSDALTNAITPALVRGVQVEGITYKLPRADSSTPSGSP